MAISKADMIAMLRAKKEGAANKAQGGGTGDNASYPFWNIPDGTSATVRFLADGDEENPFFWREKQVIKLPFEGVVDGDNSHNRAVTVNVPCVEMWGMPCPILAQVRPMWKDPAKEDIARAYWKKRSFLFQGFVVSNPLDEPVPENPIRRFIINKTIYDIIETSLLNDEMEDMPTDPVGGRDFKISKTRKGEYANYSTSSWSMRTRSLNEEEQAAIQKHGLFTLNDFLGRKPDADELEALKAMFEASLAGEPYDMASFGRYFKPYGSRNSDEGGNGGGDEAVASRAARVTESAPASAPAASTASDGGKPSTQDILARIKARNKG